MKKYQNFSTLNSISSQLQRLKNISCNFMFAPNKVNQNHARRASQTE